MHFEIIGVIEMSQNVIEPRFVICVRNEGCEDLALCKAYQVLVDASAAKDGYIRVIDESGEDYLYPGSYFVPVDLTQEAERSLLEALSSPVA